MTRCSSLACSLGLLAGLFCGPGHAAPVRLIDSLDDAAGGGPLGCAAGLSLDADATLLLDETASATLLRRREDQPERIVLSAAGTGALGSSKPRAARHAAVVIAAAERRGAS